VHKIRRRFSSIRLGESPFSVGTLSVVYRLHSRFYAVGGYRIGPPDGWPNTFINLTRVQTLGDK
jgi:hypothetical protein